MIISYVMVDRTRFLSAMHNRYYEEDIRMKRTEKIEVKLTAEEKAVLTAKAEACGTTKSTLIRKLIADDERIIVLGDSRQILTDVYCLRDLLEQCLAVKTFDAVVAKQVRDAMHQLGVGICEAAHAVTELGEDEEADENVDSENGE